MCQGQVCTAFSRVLDQTILNLEYCTAIWGYNFKSFAVELRGRGEIP